MEFKDKLKVIGLMSGTSCDGLDIALVEIKGCQDSLKFKFINGTSAPYTKLQREMLIKTILAKSVETKFISQLNFFLPKIWSEMISEFLNNIQFNPSDIDLIGSHGQTIWHQPETEQFNNEQISSTMQIGDPSVLAQLLSIPVVGDFRVADVALGGQGAPLIPYFDWILFKNVKKNILAINIGGITNFTYNSEDGDLERVRALDCGPGNVLIDMAMQNLYNKPFDKDGKIANRGKLAVELFEFIKSIDGFVESIPPKSTGREYYDIEFLNKIIEFAIKNKIPKEDIIHTISQYTAYAIYRNYELFIKKVITVDEIVISGGGLNNYFIVNKLNFYFSKQRVISIENYGINNDLKEAIGFAILANETVKDKPTNNPNITGAKRPAILGKICLV